MIFDELIKFLGIFMLIAIGYGFISGELQREMKSPSVCNTRDDIKYSKLESYLSTIEYKLSIQNCLLQKLVDNTVTSESTEEQTEETEK